MKKVIVAIVVLALIITAGILETVFVDKLFGKLDNRLNEIEACIKQESPEALEKTDELVGWWENKRKFMELFTYSPDVRAFSVALGEAQGSLECNDYDNALSKLQSLLVMSANIHSILDFNIADII